VAAIGDRSHDRGQLILLGGLTLAVLLVGLAVILNAAIYSENLASRGDAIGADDALVFRDETETAVSGLIAGVNADSTLGESELRTAIADWSETTALQYVRNGAETEVVVPTGGVNDPDGDGSIESVDLRLSFRTEQVYYETAFRVRP
jgi:hypothetical protein